MNVFTNTKKFNKLIIVLVFLILFNFTCPKQVEAAWLSPADILDSLYIGAGNLFFTIVDGIMRIVNRIFVRRYAKL